MPRVEKGFSKIAARLPAEKQRFGLLVHQLRKQGVDLRKAQEQAYTQILAESLLEGIEHTCGGGGRRTETVQNGPTTPQNRTEKERLLPRVNLSPVVIPLLHILIAAHYPTARLAINGRAASGQQ